VLFVGRLAHPHCRTRIEPEDYQRRRSGIPGFPRCGKRFIPGERYPPKRIGNSIHIFAQGQGSDFIRCMAAWINWGVSEFLIQTTLKRDFLPQCSTHRRSPGRNGRVIPDSKAPVLLSRVATTFCINDSPLLSMALILTTISFLRDSLRCSIPSRKPGGGQQLAAVSHSMVLEC
jgi:hypothetical protein